MMQCPHFFLLFYPHPLQQPLTYLKQPKMLVASEGHLVVFGTNMHVYRMNRLLGVWKERAGWHGGNAADWYSVCVSFESRPGQCPGMSKVFFSPSIQIAEEYLYETTTASFQILSNSPFINDPLIRRYTVTPMLRVSLTLTSPLSSQTRQGFPLSRSNRPKVEIELNGYFTAFHVGFPYATVI
jgi:hypothetical protein